MGHDLSVLTFVPNSHELRNDDDDFIVWIPPNISDRQELFSILDHEFKFPYFGRNWDALYDLLRDFFWIQKRRIVMVHEDLPIQLGDKDLRTYLEILIDAIKDWKPEDNHELIVVFPLKYRETVREILSGIA